MRKGFTLVELLVVIAIVGLLATMGIVQIQRQARGRALDAAMLTHAREMKLAMQQYVTSTGELPSGVGGNPTSPYWTTATAGSGQTWEALEAVMGLKLPRPPHSTREYYEYYRSWPNASGCQNKAILRMPALTGSAMIRDCDENYAGQGSTFVLTP